ncbi:hypothetical protein K0B96_00365 [Horticoccus luteus]|uniref:Ig-like domain-containing protein n=1 Tax=Horticoccus luteus TaxID=2862869 RepID=A0A8F9XGE5_9BACT|nr:immunoglobulin domain-containing protein [Horticoccus luteus]QYM79102.1 hypothetical protein K0B96_00365 [Horticoccus luteus]
MARFRALVVAVAASLFVFAPGAAAGVTNADLTAAALVGKTLNCTILGGNAPFESSGDFAIRLGWPDTIQYSIATSSGSAEAHIGIYSHNTTTDGVDLKLSSYSANGGVNLNLFAADSPVATAVVGPGKAYFEMNAPGANKHGTFTINGGVASYAGTYTGKIGSKVTSGGTVTLNPELTDYTVIISAGGNVTANIGGLTPAMIGFVDASGAITFNSGDGIGFYHITSATVSGGQVLSDYGTAMGGAQYRFEPPAAAPVPPTIDEQPVSQIVSLGGDVTFTVTVTGSGFSYQWYFNGHALVGEINASLILHAITLAQAGHYRVEMTSSGGAVASEEVTLTVGTPSSAGRLTNLSVRGKAGVGDETLIVGLVVSAGGPGAPGGKPFLVRAVGPSLTGLGVAGALVDPSLTVYSGTTAIDSNDNWGGEAALVSTAARLGAFALTGPDSKDAAIRGEAEAGAYTLHATGQAGGIVLAEIYDAAETFADVSPRLVNVSARAEVGTGDDVLIAGFVVSGSTPRTVLIRALGPQLAQSGVTGMLADPQLAIHAGNAVVAQNDNWSDATNAAVIATTSTTVGAAAMTSGAKDAAVLVTLAPGVYTAVVTGVGQTTGVALVEIFDVP